MEVANGEFIRQNVGVTSSGHCKNFKYLLHQSENNLKC